MNDDQITALAREYAELTDGSPVDIAYRKAIAENAFRFLLRRFCLVEKGKVEAELKICVSLRDGNTSPNIGSAIRHHRGAEGIRVLESLFPEIAKEVEG